MSNENHNLSYFMIRAAEHCAIVALHEAGHAIVARYYGAVAAASLHIDRASLTGCTEYDRGFTEHQFRIVSLAGAASYELWSRPSVTAEEMIKEKWTPTRRDAEAAGEYSTADLAECLQIMRSHWSELEAEAALLLKSFSEPPIPIRSKGLEYALFPDDKEQKE